MLHPTKREIKRIIKRENSNKQIFHLSLIKEKESHGQKLRFIPHQKERKRIIKRENLVMGKYSISFLKKREKEKIHWWTNIMLYPKGKRKIKRKKNQQWTNIPLCPHKRKKKKKIYGKILCFILHQKKKKKNN